MKTELEKMIAGEMYDPSDRESSHTEEIVHVSSAERLTMRWIQSPVQAC